MADPFIGEIRVTSFTFAPQGWAMCNGQLLAINTNQALFSLLGTTYGGNGTTNFALPDLRGRAPMHEGGGHVLGERAGSEALALTQQNMPAHNHVLLASTAPGSAAQPAGAAFGAARGQYGESIDATLIPTTLASAGQTQAHENRPPYLVLNFIIAIVGIYPSNN
jgi:microcystin-dependent protein